MRQDAPDQDEALCGGVEPYVAVRGGERMPPCSARRLQISAWSIHVHINM